MLEALHDGPKSLNIASAASVGLEPLAEGGVEGRVFGPGNGARFFDEVGVGAEGDVLHVVSVHCSRVHGNCTFTVSLSEFRTL